MTVALKWSHATNSLEQITRAAEDPSITAVECDVMLGVANESGTHFYETPILAHPPHRESDISVATLLLRMTEKNHQGDNILRKHLKLDFKEMKAVEPSLELLKMARLSNPLGKTIFLNADVLVGPGRRKDTPVPPNMFLETCLNHIRSSKDKNIFFSFSLGYQCDWSRGEPYEKDDVIRMAELAHKYKLTSESGVGLVLALNARVLALNPGVFDGLLREFPRSTILAWTGSGEPSIPQHLLDKISDHFASEGMLERISFDCDIQQVNVTKHSVYTDKKDSGENLPYLWFGAGLLTGVAIGVAVGRKLW